MGLEKIHKERIINVQCSKEIFLKKNTRHYVQLNTSSQFDIRLMNTDLSDIVLVYLWQVHGIDFYGLRDLGAYDRYQNKRTIRIKTMQRQDLTLINFTLEEIK